MQNNTKHKLSIYLFLLLALSVLSYFSFIGSYGEYGEGLINSDAHNYMGMLAARDHPENFTTDIALHNALESTKIFKTIHMPLVSWLADGDDYAGAWAALMPVHMFIYLLGFFLLGMVLFRHVGWAVFFAVFLSIYVRTEWVTFWGLSSVSLRTTYAALLGFVLALALKYKEDCRWWPLVLAGAGGLAYMHTVSMPVGGLMVWVGFASQLFYMNKKQAKKSIGWLLVAGISFLVCVAPAVWGYLSNHTPLDAKSSEYLWTSLKHRSPSYFDFVGSLTSFFVGSLSRSLLFISAMVSVAYVLKVASLEHRKKILMISGWALGAFICGSVLYPLDQLWAKFNNSWPMQISLGRANRYLIPTSMMLASYGAYVFWEHADGPKKRWIVIAGLLILLITPIIEFKGRGAYKTVAFGVQKVISDPRWLFNPRGYGFVDQEKPWITAAKANIPVGARVYTTYGNLGLELRNGALRGVLFSQKDVGWLHYTVPDQFVASLDIFMKLRNKLPSNQSQVPSYTLAELKVAKSLKAEYFIYDLLKVSEDMVRKEWMPIWTDGKVTIAVRR